MSARRRVEIKPGERNLSVAIEMPVGTASLQGRVGPGFTTPTGAVEVLLWDFKRETGAFVHAASGRYSIEHLPSGDYVLMPGDFRGGLPRARVSVREGEKKVFDLDAPLCRLPAGLSAEVGTAGVCVVSDTGLPLPELDVYFTDPSRARLDPVAVTDLRANFYGLSGEHILHASYPGFRPGTRNVTIPRGISWSLPLAPFFQVLSLEPDSRPAN